MADIDRERDINLLHSLTEELQDLINKLGLISMTDAATLRETSRASVFQLVQRNRLDSELILGRRYVYKSQITGFTSAKPGPALGTHYKRETKKAKTAKK